MTCISAKEFLERFPAPIPTEDFTDVYKDDIVLSRDSRISGVVTNVVVKRPARAIIDGTVLGFVTIESDAVAYVSGSISKGIRIDGSAYISGNVGGDIVLSRHGVLALDGGVSGEIVDAS